MTFAVDTAAAYDSAGVEEWTRTLTLQPDGRGVVILDNFVLKEVRAPNQLNFMCASQPDISKTGVVSFSIDGEQLQLSYDPRLFVAETEPITLTDKRLSAV